MSTSIEVSLNNFKKLIGSVRVTSNHLFTVCDYVYKVKQKHEGTMWHMDAAVVIVANLCKKLFDDHFESLSQTDLAKIRALSRYNQFLELRPTSTRSKESVALRLRLFIRDLEPAIDDLEECFKAEKVFWLMLCQVPEYALPPELQELMQQHKLIQANPFHAKLYNRDQLKHIADERVYVVKSYGKRVQMLETTFKKSKLGFGSEPLSIKSVMASVHK